MCVCLCVLYFQVIIFSKLTLSSTCFPDSTIITPRVEGTLQILGVRWKLSGTIVGFHNFELCHPKKIIKGRRKTKHMPNEKFKFMVIKVDALILPFLIILFFST